MATRYALAVRHRTILLPWDFEWRFDKWSKPYSECPASGVAYQLLDPVGQWPEECSYLNDDYEAYTVPGGEQGLCFCCKNLTPYKGLHFSCSQCFPVDNYRYLRVYASTLHFASQIWNYPSRKVAEQSLIQKLQSSSDNQIAGKTHT